MLLSGKGTSGSLDVQRTCGWINRICDCEVNRHRKRRQPRKSWIWSQLASERTTQNVKPTAQWNLMKHRIVNECPQWVVKTNPWKYHFILQSMWFNPLVVFFSSSFVQGLKQSSENVLSRLDLYFVCPTIDWQHAQLVHLYAIVSFLHLLAFSFHFSNIASSTGSPLPNMYSTSDFSSSTLFASSILVAE